MINPYETDHLAKLRPGLAECTVLLKKDGAFPLTGPGDIAAYGSGVRHTIKGGTGSGEVNSRFFVTVEQGLEQVGFAVTTKNWLDAYDAVLEQSRVEFKQEIKRRAKEKHVQPVIEAMGAIMPEPEYEFPLDGAGDTAIYVLSRISGEGNDRQVVPGDFLLTETEQRDILALNAQYKNFMLVLNVGGPVDLSPVLNVKNILVLSQLGVETGCVLADLLLGTAYPSGKLASTWAKAEDYPNVGNFGDLNNTYYREGIYVGYRWFDAVGKPPIFPFGFGLGYTEFSLRNPRVTAEGLRIAVTADLTNLGSLPGKETLQIYVSAPWGKLDKPVKDLAAFIKTEQVDPGQSAKVTAAFDLRDSACYAEELAAYILEPGDYVVRIGFSSGETQPVCLLRLQEGIFVRNVRNLFAPPGFQDWTPEAPKGQTDPPLPVLVLSAAELEPETVDYASEEPIEDAVANVTGEELCLMNMGAFDPKAGRMSVIGSASLSVAGAAGESTGVFLERGIPSMVMADGPAGVRISPRYYRDKKGLHSLEPPIPATLLEFIPKPLQRMIGGTPKLPKKAQLQEQYCTAVPIGTALAQSFNPEFAGLCGDIIGSEMEQFGVHLWLAPTLNIHRSPLCGRNFEYYSEDPLISGRMAAAMAKAVQQHPHCGVTMKHFAANNQETNRFFSNSVVSERALREIYLKGFALCIREAQPAAIMTSYNLINGTHTSENRALCTDLLRGEFRFSGVCMTDWLVQGTEPPPGTEHSAPDPALIAAAGGDLFMPGHKKDQERLRQGLREGRVTEQQLRINASRVCRLAKKLALEP